MSKKRIENLRQKYDGFSDAENDIPQYRGFYDVDDTGTPIEPIYFPSDLDRKRERKSAAHTRFTLEARRGVRSGSDLEANVRDAIVETVASAFGSAPSDTAEHLKGDLFLVARDAHEKVSGFAVLNHVAPARLFPQTADLTQQGGYFAAAAVRKEHQREGLYHLLTEARLDESLMIRLPIIFTRTQNPAVEQGIRSELTLAVEEKRLVRYQVERRLVPRCYGQQLAENQPQVSEREIQKAYE